MAVDYSASAPTSTGGKKQKKPSTSGYKLPDFTPSSSGSGSSGGGRSTSYQPQQGYTRLTSTPPIEVELNWAPQVVTRDPELVDYPELAGLGGLSAETEEDQQLKADAILQLQQQEDQREAKLEQRHTRPRRSYELTWEQYNSLSPEAKAAVDFNTELVAAREKDLNAEYDPRAKQQKRYDSSIEEMFGEGGGSETFAPETVALLNQIGYEPPTEGVGSDLDDFLGLQAAVTQKDLRKWGTDPAEQGTFGTAEDSIKTELAQHTQKLQASMVKANTMLKDFRTTLDAERNPFLKHYGGEPNKVNAGAGWDDDPRSLYFRKIFEAFANKGINNADVWADFNVQVPEADRPLFYAFADTMTQRAEDYRVELGDVEGIKYIDPQKLRTELGLEKAGGRDAR